jgi:hypothetical protein
MFRLRFPDGDREFRSMPEPPTVGMELSARGRRWNVDHVKGTDIFLVDAGAPDFELNSMSIAGAWQPSSDSDRA